MVSFKQTFPTEAWSLLVWDCQRGTIEITGVCVLPVGIGGELWNSSSISLWLLCQVCEFLANFSFTGIERREYLYQFTSPETQETRKVLWVCVLLQVPFPWFLQVYKSNT